MRRMTWGVSSKGVQRSFLQATRNLSILSRTALSAAMSTLADLDQQYNTTLVDPTQAAPFTAEIMRLRGPSLQERGLILLQAGGRPLDNQGKRKPSDSWLELRYPFATDTLLRMRYAHHSSGSVRAERLLEDADSFAADIALQHAGRPNTMMV